MKLKELCSYLDSAIPLSFQEDYDNSGLQAGDPEKEINSAMVAVDITGQVIDEALKEGCDVIISHHPVIFYGLKRLAGITPAEKILVKAIRNELAIYSAHTNLDVVVNGVSRKMAHKLGLVDVKVLKPLKNKLLKLVTYVPESHLEQVREALFSSGAGVIGNYDSCSFGVTGTGTFRGGEHTNPFSGEKGIVNFEKEVRFETILYNYLKNRVVDALLQAHPYEEVAYDIYPLQNDNIKEGMGCTGILPAEMEEKEFLQLVAKVFSSEGIRYSAMTGKTISKVALCGGSGSSLIKDAVLSGADAFVTADIKYHSFFEPDGRILLADVGHYESEKFSREILYDLIIKKFPTFAVRFSEVNTNPINYL